MGVFSTIAIAASDSTAGRPMRTDISSDGWKSGNAQNLYNVMYNQFSNKYKNPPPSPINVGGNQFDQKGLIVPSAMLRRGGMATQKVSGASGITGAGADLYPNMGGKDTIG